MKNNNTFKNILITGASGLIGSNFINYLTKDISTKNVKLIICTYNSNKVVFPKCKCIHSDIADKDDVQKLAEYNPNLIIHCAALTKISFCEKNKNLAHQINVIGTKNVVELAEKTKAKLVYISTDAVFDGRKGYYSESDEPNPLNVYAATKLEGEMICLKEYDDVLIARISPFAKNFINNNSSFLEDIINTLKEGKIYTGFYDAKTSLLNIKYVYNYIMGLCERNVKGIFHIGCYESMSKYNFAKEVARVFGYDENLIKKESIETLFKKDNTKRSKDCSFNISKMLNFLHLKSTPNITAMLIEFKNDYYGR